MYFCQNLGFNDMIHIEDFTFNAFQTRCSVVWDSEGSCAFVDPGCCTPAELSQLTGLVSSRGLKPVCIMLTHAHFDHIYGVSALSEHYGGLPVYMHPAEKYTLENTNPYVCKSFGLPLPDTAFARSLLEGTPDNGSVLRTVAEDDVIEVGSLRFNVLETPGHTRGGVCFYEKAEGTLFSGDTLFAGAIGRTDHPGGDYDQLIRNILDKLVTLDGSVSVIPGHGPCSDIATEGMTNPFILPFNEPYDE